MVKVTKVAVFILFMVLSTQKGQAQFPTSEELADSVFFALKSGKFENLKAYTPSYQDVKSTFDSLKLEKDDSHILIKQKTIVYVLKKDHKELVKESKDKEINLLKMELAGKKNLPGEFEGKVYSLVELHCLYKKKKFTIGFTALEMNQKWFIGGDLGWR